MKEMLVRLNKYISESGAASRRKAEELILQNRVSVNQKIVNNLSFKVDDENDIVYLDGEKITPRRHLYFLLNKPKGVVTTTSDEKSRITVVDLIKSRERIFPVGRLDYNTTGTLILTNDGDFSQLLTHPGNNIPRVYEVKLDKPLSDHDKQSLLNGIYIEGVKGKFSKVFFPQKNNFKFVEVTGTEGRNHFVKVMFRKLGYTVTSLNRKSFAGIYADIPQGSYRKLSLLEVKKIKEKYGH
jgi:23S rRNA pseudouridine2605 synthase